MESRRLQRTRMHRAAFLSIRNQNIKEGFIDPADMLFVTPLNSWRNTRASDFAQVTCHCTDRLPRYLSGGPNGIRVMPEASRRLFPPNLVILKSVSLPLDQLNTRESICGCWESRGCTAEPQRRHALSRCSCPLPPLDEQEDICDFIDELFRTERLLVSLCERLYNLQDEMREALLKS